MDAAVVGDVVSVISQRRGKERQEPQAGDPELLEVIELLDQPREVTDAVAVRIEESLHVRFVDDRVLVPERVAVDGADHSGTVPARRGSRERESLCVSGRVTSSRVSAAATSRRQIWVATFGAALVLGLVALVPRVHQPLSYHDFADKRVLLGIANAGDVLSNLGFL